MGKMSKARQLELVKEWSDAQRELKEVKEREKELRLLVVKHVFQDHGFGSDRKVFGDMAVKGKFGLRYQVDKKQWAKIEHKLSDRAKSCLSWSPRFKVSVYDTLTDKECKLIDKCITATPALPSIEVEYYE